MASRSLVSTTVSVGTATTDIVGMSADGQYVMLENLEPSAHGDDYARHGYMFQTHFQWSVAGNSVEWWNFATPTLGAQIYYKEINSDASNLLFSIVEGSTVTTTGSAFPLHNLDRQYGLDNATTVFTAATTATGGSAISNEWISGTNKAGGEAEVVKIITLGGGQDYAFKLENLTSSAASGFFQIGFVENYDHLNEIWVGSGTEHVGYRLAGGDTLQLPMIQGQTIQAIGERDGVQLAVLVQD